MAAKCDKDARTLCFKRGDTFTLDLVVTDENNEASLALAAELAVLTETLTELQEADPQDLAAIATAQAAVDAKQLEWETSIIVDITDWTILAKIGLRGRYSHDLDVTIIDAATGAFNISKPYADTEDWKTREHVVDVQFDRPGHGRVSTQTVFVLVEEDVT